MFERTWADAEQFSISACLRELKHALFENEAFTDSVTSSVILKKYWKTKTENPNIVYRRVPRLVPPLGKINNVAPFWNRNSVLVNKLCSFVAVTSLLWTFCPAMCCTCSRQPRRSSVKLIKMFGPWSSACSLVLIHTICTKQINTCFKNNFRVT